MRSDSTAPKHAPAQKEEPRPQPGFCVFGPFGSAYCWTGACCCGSGSWDCVLPIGAEATSLVHTSWNTTRLSGVDYLVKQVARGAAEDDERNDAAPIEAIAASASAVVLMLNIALSKRLLG